MHTYRTAEVARRVGLHVNTVRLYEDLGLIPKPERKLNGYRVFTDLHIEQIRLARIGFEIEVLQNGLRKQVVAIIKMSASGNLDGAILLTNKYLANIQQEQDNAQEAIVLVNQILADAHLAGHSAMKRKEAAEYLHVSMDTLRNWELNGLLTIKRKRNGYRVYTDEDLQRLKIIRSLRCANYSLESILRMLNALSRDVDVNVEQALNTPDEQAEIISVCDKLITSLLDAGFNAVRMLEQLEYMKKL